MATTQYIIDLGVVDGTSNVSYLLSDQAQETLRSFTPRKVEECFGPGDARLTEDSYNRSKGYADPEWYWVSSKRQVWGIGWRWGEPRLRGRSSIRWKNAVGATWNPATAEDAAEFVEFLKKEITTNA